MKKLTIFPLILILFTCFGCDTKQKGPSHLSVGRDKLINSGLTIEAVDHLTKAEKEEEDKTEPRALLVIAYSHALSSDAAKGQGVEAEYKKQRTQRIAALNEAEINKMIEILSKRSEVQQDGFQALVEKGTDAAVLIIDNLAQGSYPDIHKNFISALEQMGTKAIDPILDSVADAEVNPAVKMKLIQVLGEIGDEKTAERLKAIDMTDMSDALKMSVYTTLYRLGDNKYKFEILAGLTANEVEVRRAAAKAMANLKNVNTNTLITALKENDSQVVADIAEALSVHKTKDAVEPLVNIFKSEHSPKAKQAALNTLATYIEAGSGLTKGLARRLTLLLISKEVSSPEDRLRLVQFLKKRMVKQLKAATTFDDELVTKLYNYVQNDEDSTFVKAELNELLNVIKK
jgi:HEAT repeat protein